MLTVRTEIRRQLSLRRTKLALGLALALPVVLVAAFELGGNDQDDTLSFAALATASGGNFTVFTLGAAAGILLTVIVALVCGDTVANEASCGSLRYLLAVPVPRARLLGVKLVVSLLMSSLALVILAVTSLCVGGAAFGWGSLRTPYGGNLVGADAVWRLAGTVGYLAVTLVLVAALAFWLSTATDAPLAAVGGAVMVIIVSKILNQVDALGVIRSLLPMHYASQWSGLYVDPVRLDGMAKGAFSTVVYSAIFFACAWWTFLRKDILS
ncbi:ABC transporter permease [Actinopolymorpha sp. B17G11]|uniref:ABC transporter permease n=1 Tax=unclassified Actinopolymorpha TaxID=2627063 RepID=UPI0032D9A5D7